MDELSKIQRVVKKVIPDCTIGIHAGGRNWLPMTVLGIMLGVDLVQGPGALETSNMMTLEQIVVDDEIACLCKRLRDGVDMSEA